MVDNLNRKIFKLFGKTMVSTITFLIQEHLNKMVLRGRINLYKKWLKEGLMQIELASSLPIAHPHCRQGYHYGCDSSPICCI